MSIGKALKGLLKTVAPTIATAVGGPLGGVAMKFLADKFTGGDTGSVEDFLLSADPQALKALKVADMEFQKEMRSLDIDLERVHALDRDSARGLAKSKGIWPQVVISAVYSVGYFVVVYMFMAGHIQVAPEHNVMFGGLLGVLTTAQVQIMNFWFGSSSGSKEKTQVLANGKSG
jgi:hypothetical protein